MKRSQSKDPNSRRHAWLLLAGIPLYAAFLVLWRPSAAVAESHPGGHAPIGVMADHTHDKGEVMLSYRYMRMRMNGNRDNDDRVGANRVLDQFPVAPLRMDMQMHMFGAMYAPIDRVTLMLTVPYVELDMDHKTRMGAHFTTRSDGIGDVRAAGLIRLLKSHGHNVHAQLGVSFPTGSISEQDVTPASGGTTVRLPYPMQLGSGSYDFLPGLTYHGHTGAYNWGAQGQGEIRMNDNHANYRVGNEYMLTAWGGIDLADWVSTSFRLQWRQSVNYHNRDESPSVNPNVVPTADPGRRAGARLDALFGANFMMPRGMFSGLRIAIEMGVPAYQRLDGPQLETDWTLTTGVQYAF
jgi:hypothetical protein